MYVFHHPPILISGCLSIYLSISKSVCLSVRLSLSHPTIRLYQQVSTVCIQVCVCISESVISQKKPLHDKIRDMYMTV